MAGGHRFIDDLWKHTMADDALFHQAFSASIMIDDERVSLLNMTYIL